eukprot:2382913-Prymnesium_polylepis.1
MAPPGGGRVVRCEGHRLGLLGADCLRRLGLLVRPHTPTTVEPRLHVLVGQSPRIVPLRCRPCPSDVVRQPVCEVAGRGLLSVRRRAGRHVLAESTARGDVTLGLERPAGRGYGAERYGAERYGAGQEEGRDGQRGR